MSHAAHSRDVPADRVEDDSDPDSPLALTKRSWHYVARKTLREFSKDQCTDLAAALTYYAVLAMFPAAIALLSLVSLVGQGQHSVDTIVTILRQIGARSQAHTIKPILTDLSNTPGGGLALVLGLLGALWSASGYVGAFGRAMNRMYEIQEGRPIWKLRPTVLLVTALLVVLAAVTMVGLVVSGPVAGAIGAQLGLGSTVVNAWNIVKWPVMLLIIGLIVAILYWSTPNVRQPRFRWLSVGAGVAIVGWIVVSALFALYVSHFSSYDKTYGSLAGVIVFLLWLWLTNLALLFGAELDAELERGRELQAGIAAEERIQLPPRDDRNIKKAEKKQRKDVEKGRRIRLENGNGNGNGSSAGEDAGSRR
ncbi:YihY/virulence factor BrkB family protein [Nocardioides panaciterrulae]|uniref:Membrane protein n=1 Tax=Nocardioides panaciterrulae TaxID=661492 RepID=A0A7Y9E7N9_9ACTN|nr:YihY/virulence factor BrkB family protein [Nocardioides panaciterrulae]NYD42675.1 membrane protein [Nocardioides panaciterrulae]